MFEKPPTKKAVHSAAVLADGLLRVKHREEVRAMLKRNAEKADAEKLAVKKAREDAATEKLACAADRDAYARSVVAVSRRCEVMQAREKARAAFVRDAGPAVREGRVDAEAVAGMAEAAGAFAEAEVVAAHRRLDVLTSDAQARARDAAAKKARQRAEADAAAGSRQQAEWERDKAVWRKAFAEASKPDPKSRG